uniref:Limbin-like n=1 Tax=Camelus bactrianus TaxID=9837 RepID=A0A9W3H932_CAMBA|nr:limbin-like [Camelus bactrianus]
MRQDAHGCFSQMDRTLALPRIRARVLLQRFQTAWREAESSKLDQALAAPELQVFRVWHPLCPGIHTPGTSSRGAQRRGHSVTFVKKQVRVQVEHTVTPGAGLC